jgi:general secretion pathway protein A
MYTQFYGFSHKPFELTPNPHVIYLSETHQEALSVLLYGVYNRKGFLQVSGDVGSGKSTLVQALIGKLAENIHLCHIPNPNFTIDEFYYYISAKFGLDEFDGNRAKFILNLAEFIKQCREKDEFVLLIIDEAQVLSLELLEQIRLLSNQEYTEFGVLSIFFVGQPELNVLLKHKKMDPLRNRIGIRFNLEPLTLDETVAYIQFRLRKAGRTVLLFSQKAFQKIHEASGGIPRSINILCDNALLEGFAEQRGVIDENIIIDCVKELEQLDGDSIPTENEAISIKKEADPVSPNPALKKITEDKKKIQPKSLRKKFAFVLVILCALFFALMYTTEYWGKLPGTEPAKTWFEIIKVDESIFDKIKKLFNAVQSSAEFNAAENSTISEKNIESSLHQIEKNNTQNTPAIRNKSITKSAIESLPKDDAITEPVKTWQNPGRTTYVSIISNVGGANIRSDPSMSANVLVAVSPGYPLRVIDHQEDWTMVENFRKKKGWVSNSLIMENYTVILISDDVNLLKGPSHQDEIVAKIDSGTIMHIEKRQGRWVKVKNRDGAIGWINKDMAWP